MAWRLLQMAGADFESGRSGQSAADFTEVRLGNLFELFVN